MLNDTINDTINDAITELSKDEQKVYELIKAGRHYSKAELASEIGKSKAKLKDTYITHESDGEQILLDTSSSFAGLIRSNKTAAFIVECLKQDIPD